MDEAKDSPNITYFHIKYILFLSHSKYKCGENLFQKINLECRLSANFSLPLLRWQNRVTCSNIVIVEKEEREKREKSDDKDIFPFFFFFSPPHRTCTIVHTIIQHASSGSVFKIHILSRRNARWFPFLFSEETNESLKNARLFLRRRSECVCV